MKREDWKGFDNLHCRDKWKQDVLKQLPNNKKHKQLVLRFAIVFIVFAGLTLTVVATNDHVQEWLTTIFSPPKKSTQKQVTVTSEPTMEEWQSTYFINDTYYIPMSEEEVQKNTTFTVYEGNEKLKETVHKQTVNLSLPIPNGVKKVVLPYLEINESVYPIVADTSENMKAVHITKKLVLIEIYTDSFYNTYLLNVEDKKVTSIGNMETAQLPSLKNVPKRLAYGTQASKDGRYFLYRTNAVNGRWVKNKESQIWMLYDIKTNTYKALSTKYLPGYTIGNELTILGNKTIATSFSKADGSYYPVTYDISAEKWKEWKAYSCNMPFVSDYLYQLVDRKIKLWNLKTQEKISIPMQIEKDDTVDVFNGFIIHSQYRRIKEIYIMEQNRWVNLEKLPMDGTVSMAYLYDNHTIALEVEQQWYLIDFS